MSRKVLTRSAADRTPTEVSPNADRELQNCGNHMTHSACLSSSLGNPVGDIHKFLEDLATRFQALLFPAFIRREGGTREENGDDKDTGFFHGSAPKHLLDSCAIGSR